MKILIQLTFILIKQLTFKMNKLKEWLSGCLVEVFALICITIFIESLIFIYKLLTQ